MAFLQGVMIGLIALVIAPGYFFHFDVTPKVAVLLAGTAALLIMAARSRGMPRGPRLFAILLVLNAGSLAISTALSSNRSISLYGSSARRFGAVVECAIMLFAWLVAWHSTGRQDRVRVVLRVVSIAGMLSAAYGIAQYRMVHTAGTLGNAGAFAVWLLMCVFLDLALAQMEKARAWRAVAQSAAALSLAAMLLTGTRAALVGLAAGTAVWLFWGGFRPSRRWVSAAVVVLCCAGLCTLRWFPDDPASGARRLLWRDTVAMAARRPLAGYGPEVFLAEFPQFESKALAETDPSLVYESPRNILLDAAIAQGFPGLLLFCGLCAVGFVAAWRLKAGWLAAALAAGIVSLQFTAFTVPTAVLFLATIALAAGLATGRGAPRRAAVFAGMAPIPALALLFLALRLTVSDHALAVTKHLLETHDLRAATAEYEIYWSWHLPGSSADLWYSRSWMEVARNTQDIRVLEQALEVSEQSAARAAESAEEPFAAWYNLAQISALHDDSEAVESSLRRAIAANPNWFKPHWMLAQQLRRESRLEEAGKEAALAAELDSGHHPEVAQTLVEVGARQTGSHAP